MKTYPVRFEVAGPAAMFSRPDAGSTPISYPIPTYSAAKGMFEAVARKRGAYIRPTRVEVCNPVRFERYVTNYGGPLRKPIQVKGNNNYQLMATILVDVRYVVHGVVESDGLAGGGINWRHALQDLFLRRLERGQSFYTPCLGWREFVPSYFGEVRDDTRPDPTIDLEIPALLHSIFEGPANGRLRPRFHRNAQVRAGVLDYLTEAYDAE